MNAWGDYTQFLIAMIVIVNPLGAVPLFIALTEGQPKQARQHTASVAAMTVGIVLVSTIFAGEPLLRFFGISLASFKVGGGMLILLMAISMMHARSGDIRHTKEEAKEATDKDSVGVVPLAIPLLSGPGAMSTVIVLAHKASAWYDITFLVFAALSVSAMVWAAMRLADPISKALGHTGINIVTRVMGLILAAIGVEFITGGLVILLPGLG
ncbi:UPF0056 inner membrane protein YchE [hydrothermal vent metagenome]|uniref:UPF0056 inner membrane protein YchE n=1 Tax=hydrothermal vent metagenome TaxID=652676 RepID=A0A3B1BLC0_9ZZZZ